MKTEKFIRNHPRIILAFIIGLLGITIYLCLTNLRLSNKLSRYNPESETVRLITINSSNATGKDEVPSVKYSVTQAKFTKADPYGSLAVPENVLYWDTRAQASSSFTNALDSITSEPSSLMSAQMVPGIIPTKQDSLVQLLLTRKNLEMSYYNKVQGNYYSSTYNLDLERYKYNWTLDNGLTKAKYQKFTIGPYIQGDYQIFNKAFKISSGLSFKTRKFNYNLGISLIHDPMVNQKIRPDLEVSVKYEFNRWLK